MDQSTNDAPTPPVPDGGAPAADALAGVSGAGMPGAASIEDVLARIEADTAELASLTTPEALTGWNAPVISRLVAAHTRIRHVTGRLDGVRFTLLPRIEDDGSWRAGGMARTFTSWLRVREGVSASTAGKDVRTARRLTTAPGDDRGRADQRDPDGRAGVVDRYPYR
jgi:hypothetical protein